MITYTTNKSNRNRGEVNSEPSMTIPDMSMSLSEIIRKHRLGTLPAQLVRDVLYDECDDFDSVLAEYAPGYDLVDKERELLKLRQKFELMHAPCSISKRNDSENEVTKNEPASDAKPE